MYVHLDKELEIKQLRKKQVPKAHPMPDFSRPFVMERSVKPQTVPIEPKFTPAVCKRPSMFYLTMAV
uniref:TPX2 C-terminal domain-containing protein n=1 Tax=Oryza brachyantha TaxID=4533 RepID=J3N1Z9_ORYBR